MKDYYGKFGLIIFQKMQKQLQSDLSIGRTLGPVNDL